MPSMQGRGSPAPGPGRADARAKSAKPDPQYLATPPCTILGDDRATDRRRGASLDRRQRFHAPGRSHGSPEDVTDTLFILLGAIMVLAMHAGFAFLELGTVRAQEPGERADEDPRGFRGLHGRVLLHRLLDRLRRAASSPAPRRSRRRAATTWSSSSSCSRSPRRSRRSSRAASPSARASTRRSPRRSCWWASSIRSSRASRGTRRFGVQAWIKATFGAEFHDFAGSVVVHAMGGWIGARGGAAARARGSAATRKDGRVMAHPAVEHSRSSRSARGCCRWAGSGST